ncbi:dihydrolipoyl dehydrogenase [Candidatus Bathyarchaeota archaeon A05DMB-2]|jgi:dihydrolipoamide dehydrogenase|nr:dihydrolipoyl dehydrogenase [Candidatus Bathyarchaeota archaeon A05DMB-2]
MERFDVLVIGTGSGMIIASTAVENGFRTAVVDNGPMGGTCINRGCVPSKMLIYPADVATMAQEAGKIGVHATIDSIDFRNIMTRMHTLVNGDSSRQARAVEATPDLTWFKEQGTFTGDYKLQVGDRTITANMIFIASGARPGIPPIKGIENVGYLTSDTVLELEKPPGSILIVGGGYIGVEYGHFFAGIGTKTTILQRPPRLLPDEEPEISDLLRKELQRRMEIYTNFEVMEAKQEGSMKTVVARNRENGALQEFQAEALMIAAGRVPNSDILKPEKTGVALDERGYIKVNEFLETSKKNIWAFGDAIGREMFKHVANYEAGIVWHNAVHDHKVQMDFSAAPHAVFSHPQVASVGLKEAEAKQQGYKILVGKALYKDTAMGGAMGEPEGFVKVIVERETGKILGGHIIGAEASILIQEIVNAMATETKSYAPIIRAMHIHPALPEVVQNAFGNLRPA